MVATSGALSGIFVVIANAWMNAPTGFQIVDGKPVDIDPIAAMLNPAAFPQALHMTLAAYAATGFVVAGIHAFMLLRDPHNRFHKAALAIALAVGGVASILQPLSGDLLAKRVAKTQPVKLAALEGQFETQNCAPLRMGGIPDEEAGVTRYAIEIPCLLSILARGSPKSYVLGLNEFPRDQRPPVAIVHISFQIMVACGVLLMLIALWGALRFLWSIARNKSWLESKRFLRALVLAAPLGFIAIETGWVVTEVGRQPWIIFGVMRTSEAVTPMPGLIVPFITFTLLYILLAIVTVWLLLRQVAASPQGTDAAQKEARLAA
jgi:cytochrome d ubiquinol oxidase subunit I